jgi:feruloyl esterase
MELLRRCESSVIGGIVVGLVLGFCLERPAAQADWSVYKPDMAFSDVFGRSISLRSDTPRGPVDLDRPTLAQSAAAKGDYGANAVARKAVAELLKSVSPHGPQTCQQLASLELPWVRIRSAEDVAKSAEAPAHCKVLGVIDREIGFEVDLPPPAQWNGKLIMGGGGGFLGTLQNGAKVAGLNRGYATTATDAGHSEDEEFPAGGRWAYQNPERLINFAHRGTHLTAATAKLVVQAFYKKAISHSYYSGTSGSGRLAMMSSQRYPNDFDGIVAGCPGFSRANGTLLNAWTQQAMYRTADDQYAFKPVVPPAKVKLLDDAVFAKCDANDSLKDGLITDPRTCRFDPRVDLPRCPGGEDKPECFTKEQAEAIARVHDGPSNSTGQIWPGFVYGGESIPGQWVTNRGNAYVIGAPRQQGPYSSRHYLLSNEQFRYLIFGNPSYDLHSFNFETDVPATLAAATILDANDPDLSAFRKRGGKVIFWQGWSDWAVNANVMVGYFDRLVRAMGGAEATATFARLFMMPGLGHCNTIDPGKQTPNVADFLTPLEQWVEAGVAPTRIVASHAAREGERTGGDEPRFGMPARGKVDRTRPICVYPEIAVYKGAGSIDDEANFVCRVPNGVR